MNHALIGRIAEGDQEVSQRVDGGLGGVRSHVTALDLPDLRRATSGLARALP
jgi:hypothetical protein